MMFHRLFAMALGGLLLAASTSLAADYRGIPMPVPSSRYAQLSPQPEPPDYPAASSSWYFSRSGYVKLGPQPEPPDYPAELLELLWFLRW